MSDDVKVTENSNSATDVEQRLGNMGFDELLDVEKNGLPDEVQDVPEAKENEEETKEEVNVDEPKEVEEPETDQPDYLKDTPFKSPEDLANGFKNLNNVLKKQSSELGELRKAKSAIKDEVAVNNANNNVEQKGQELSERLERIELEIQRREIDEANSNIKNQINALGEKFEEFKVDGDINEIADQIKAAREVNAEETSVHPDADKVLKIAELHKMVNDSNGLIKNIEQAYVLDKVKNGGFDSILTSAKKEASLKTIKRLNNKNTGYKPPKSIIDTEKSPKKTLDEMSYMELIELESGGQR